MKNLWEQTYETEGIGLSGGTADVYTAARDDLDGTGSAVVVCRMAFSINGSERCAKIDLSCEPDKLRAYAAMLLNAADRIDNEIGPMVARINSEGIAA